MGTLLRQALTLPQLRAAYARVLENHGQPGVDGVHVEAFRHHLDDTLKALRLEVLGGGYQPAPLKRLWLPRPGKSPRPIAVPTVRDRVLHTAVAQVLTPIVEDEFEECSYAYRQGRSVRMAVERIGLLQRQGYKWVVEADIESFFDRIPHDRLLNELAALARDDELIALVRRWLTTPVQDGERTIPVNLGVPQGSPLSPLLANLYLDHLDEALLDQGHALIRYADDFVVLAKNRDRADDAVELTTQVLQQLELKLNPLKTRVVSFDTGFKFLGWNFIRSLALPSRPAHGTPEPTARPQPRPALAWQPPPSNPEMQEAFAQALSKTPHWRAAEDPETPEATGPDELVPIAIGPGALAGADTPPALDEPTASEAPQEDDACCPDAWAPAPATRTSAREAAPPSAAAPEFDAPGDEALDIPPLPSPSLQRTLYLVDHAASLTTENQHLIVKREEQILLDLPAVNVDQVMVFGRNAITPAALHCCLRHGIPVAHLSRIGKYYGRTEPPSGEAVRLLTAQFAAHAAGHLHLPVAREMVRGKLANSALLLSRYARHRRTPPDSKAQAAIDLLRDLGRRVRNAPDLDTLRGFEGAGAAAYFGAWRQWLAPNWTFGKRQPQQGGDPINALLDFGYTLLHQSAAGLVQARGLNPWLGHLHALKSGHMALASDIMEEFRAIVVDSVILNQCINHHLGPDDFMQRQGGWTLRPEPARHFVREIELRMNGERQHPHTGEPLDLRRMIDGQIRALCNVYRQNDSSAYRACIFR